MLLEVTGLTKRFGGLAAVNGVSLQVPAGEIFGVIGPNGAGKTTLFNLISGFIAPDAGRVVFQGRDITRLPAYQVARLGLVRTFQIVKPFGKLTVLQNVVVGAFARTPDRREAHAEAERIVERVGLGPWRDAVARGLPIGRRKQLELARVLAARPSLLLLDEVMGGLSPAEQQEMVGLVRKINAEGVTVLMIEHVMSVIMPLCRRIAVLNYGEKIAEGTPDGISADERVIDAYLGREDDGEVTGRAGA